MKKLLILALAVLFAGCNPARMRSVGTPPEQRSGMPVNRSALPAAARPTPEQTRDEEPQAKESTPASEPTQMAQAQPVDETPAQDVKPLEAQPALTLPPRDDGKRAEEPRVYDPVAQESVSTCENESCSQSVITDDGKIPTSQDLRFEPRTHRLDILFVLDTSASMRDEHHAVAREITKFIAQLSNDVSYRIGILLAHGPRSKAQGVRVGQLYSETNSDYVIKADDHGSAKTSEARRAIAERVSRALMKRLNQLPIDRSEAQGEAGMLNLYSAFSDPSRRQDLKRHGLLQDNSALLVVTVADENDVCFDYEEASRRLGRPVIGTYATERDRQSERAAFESQDTCRSVAKGQRLTPDHVVQAVREAKADMPVIFTGIHYQENQVPTRADEFAKDNEPGRGYLDLIRLGEGISVDLASEDFGGALAKIGDFSNFHMKYENTFFIPGPVDLRRFDPSSVRVRIQTNNEELPLAAEKVRVRLDQRQARVEVIIDYEELQKAYVKNWIREGSKLLIDYGTSEQHTRR